jgi:hypothetical protein
MSWYYNNKEFIDKMIPDKAIGFVYNMEAVINGKKVSYIGKKNFYSNTRVKLAKKNLPTDKRKKTYKTVTKLAYNNYYSSNDVLKTAHKNGVPINRYILKICYSKTELSYYETKYQFVYEVLESDTWLNGNILGKFYKQKHHDKQ